MQLAQLLATVKSWDWQARREACERLGELRDPGALLSLLTCLEDADVEVRAAAARALGLLGMPQAVPPLIGHLLDENSHVREAVWEALAHCGAVALPALLVCAEHESPEMRQSACRALAALRDPAALAPLLARLEDENILVRQAACTALAQLGDTRAVPALLAQLSHPRGPVRIAACTALGRLRDPQAKEALLALLGDDDAQTRKAASEALDGVGEGALGRTVVQALQGDPAALEALAALATTGATWLIPLLASHLDDVNSRVRLAAAASLGKIGPACLEPVIAQLARNDAEVRRVVFQVLRAVDHPSAVPLLMAKLTDPSWRNRQVLLGALAALGSTAVAPLLSYLEAPETIARLAACQLLGTLKDARGVPGLLGRLHDVDATVRAAACEALGLLGDECVVPELLVCIRDHVPAVRQAACHALRALGAVCATDVLVPMLYEANSELTALAFGTLAELADVFAPRAHALYCGVCMTRFRWQRVEAPAVGTVSYLACRMCGKSAHALRDVNLVVAVIDSAMAEPYRVDATTARVSVLRRDGPFDFDGVEIHRATDYDVERFCMQLGNDTDPARERTYREMLCQVWQAEQLSANTLNVLRSVFGRVICET